MKKIEKLQKDFYNLQKEITSVGLFKKGSISKCYQECRSAGCRCHKDKKYRHGPYYLLTAKEKTKTKTFSVPIDMVPEVMGYIDNYHLLKSKLKSMEEVSEEIIKIKIANYRKSSKDAG